MNLSTLKETLVTIENIKNDGYDHVIFSRQDGGYCILGIHESYHHMNGEEFASLDVDVYSTGGEFLENYSTNLVKQGWGEISLEPLLEVPYEVHLLIC